MCPSAAFLSIVFLLVLINVGVFTAELSYGSIDNSALLAATPETLNLFGEKDPFLMRYEYDWFRFITPMFLHANLGHLLANLVAILIIGS